MDSSTDTLCINGFKMVNSLNELDWLIYLLDVENISSTGGKRFRELSLLANKVAAKYKAKTTYFAPSEDENYIIAINPQKDIDEQFAVNEYVLRLKERELSPVNFREAVRRILYDVIAKKFLEHNMWQASRHVFYRFLPVKLEDLDHLRIYRGVHFRCEILENGTILLILDPTVSIVTEESIYEIVSRLGIESAKKFLKGRRIVVEALRTRGGSLNLNLMLKKFGKLHPDKKAGETPVVQIGQDFVSIKEYYRKLGADFFVQKVDDNEILFQIEGEKYYYASSKGRVVLHPGELTRKEREELRKVLYPNVSQRVGLIQEFLTLVNKIEDPVLGELEFENDLYSSEYCTVFDPPRLEFGKSTLVERPDMRSSKKYRAFFRNKVRSGFAKIVSIPQDTRIVVVYPNDLSDSGARKFYSELRNVCKDSFNIELPKDVYVWQYRNRSDLNNIRKNYLAYKRKILGVLVILREKDDELYTEFKSLFKDVACQMLTLNVVWMPSQQPDRLALYHNTLRNIILGLLCKIGFRPWLLADRLIADLYIGIDTAPSMAIVCTALDAHGDYIAESRKIIRGQTLPADEMKNLLYRVLSKSKLKGDVFAVIHKDGRLLPSEYDGIIKSKEIARDLDININYAIVSVRKSVPYRIFKITDKKLEACRIGSFIKLDSRRAVLSNTGVPLLSQGLSKPMLLELVYTDDESYTIEVAAKEVHDLSYIHWASLTQKIKLPATIKFADDFAYLIKEGIEEEVIGPPL